MQKANAKLHDPEEFVKSLTEAERLVIASGELLRDSRYRSLTNAERATLDAGRMIMDQMPPTRLAEIFRVFKIAL